MKLPEKLTIEYRPSNREWKRLHTIILPCRMSIHRAILTLYSRYLINLLALNDDVLIKIELHLIIKIPEVIFIGPFKESTDYAKR